MKIFRNKIPEGFTASDSLPKSKEEALAWQEKNYKWWNENPMRYDWEKKIGFPEFTKEFYFEIDKRFFKNAAEYLDKKKSIPFDEFINFNSLKDKDVLEIGVGNGSHAQLLAKYSKKFTGIDITDYAVKSTGKRFEIFSLPGQIIKMDAEKLDFKDNSFDFIWSWGVIHHSSNTEKIIEEIQRVLRFGGEAVIMVYYKGWWNYYCMGLIKGLISGTFFKTKSLHKTVQTLTDGAIARYYSVSKWGSLIKNIFSLKYIGVYGPKSDISPFLNLIPNRIGKFLTHTLKMGSFLVCNLKK